MILPPYLDMAATTMLDPAAHTAMMPWLAPDGVGNPHAPNRHGWRAQAAVTLARDTIAQAINGAAEGVVFTSGATEAANLALKGVMMASDARRALIVPETEHACVVESARWLASLGADIRWLPVCADGMIDLNRLDDLLDDQVALVAAMAVNNEIGVMHPLAEIGARAHAAGALFYCDAAQALGKIPLDVAAMHIDLLGMSAHKIYGPQGIGALWHRPGLTLAPLLHGGGQEGHGLRSGTVPVALCAGFGAAVGRAMTTMATDAAHVETLWDEALRILGDRPHVIHGALTPRWRGILNIGFPGVDGARLLSDTRGDLSASPGSACSAAQGKMSHVLTALGVDPLLARASLRLSWGRFTSVADVTQAMTGLRDALMRQTGY